jgi:hypothetical protein
MYENTWELEMLGWSPGLGPEDILEFFRREPDEFDHWPLLRPAIDALGSENAPRRSAGLQRILYLGRLIES